MVEAGEEAAHKGYIVLLPLKWQKYHDDNGKRVKPLLQGKKRTFVHMLAERKESLKAAGDNNTSGATQGQGKALMGVRNARLKELLQEKKEEEAREAARVETLRLSKIVERQKERIRQRREKAIEESNPVLLSSNYETTVHLTKGNESHHKRVADLSEKVYKQTERHRKIAEGRLQDVPEATRRHQFAKTMALAQKVAAEGNLVDPFFKPVGKRRELTGPFYADPSRKKGEYVLQQGAKALEEQEQYKHRSVQRKMRHEDEMEQKIVKAANEKADKLHAGVSRREEAQQDRIHFAAEHNAAWKDQSIEPSLIPLRENAANKIDVANAKQDLVEADAREQEELDKQWDEYTKSLTDRFHFTLKGAENRENDVLRADEQRALKEKAILKRTAEAQMRRREDDEKRREIWAERKQITAKVETNFARNVEAMEKSYETFFETYSPEPAQRMFVKSIGSKGSPQALRPMSPVGSPGSPTPMLDEEEEKKREREEKRRAIAAAREIAAVDAFNATFEKDKIRAERMEATKQVKVAQLQHASERRVRAVDVMLEGKNGEAEKRRQDYEDHEALIQKRQALHRKDVQEVRREKVEQREQVELKAQANFVQRENKRLEKYPVIAEKRRQVREHGAAGRAEKEREIARRGEDFNAKRDAIAEQLQAGEVARDMRARTDQDERENNCRETLQRLNEDRQAKIDQKRERDAAVRQQNLSYLDIKELQRLETLRKRAHDADERQVQAAKNRRREYANRIEDRNDRKATMRPEHEDLVTKRRDENVNYRFRGKTHKKYLLDVEKLISPKT
eukprot:TRINITY_DN7536_c0_g1_i1.p1 TRINITY_DN7536_c0_g1~~TRINITY_DN7536_c0_g1_i1.p1  ORF type:complete len:805 (+),score=352.02 TRINITY_DN7536_c0_g1_i1:28-2415(+)